MSCLVMGHSLRAMVNLNASCLMDHCTPSARSVKSVSRLKLRFLTSSARSASGIPSSTFRLFEVNLCRWNPPPPDCTFPSRHGPALLLHAPTIPISIRHRHRNLDEENQPPHYQGFLHCHQLLSSTRNSNNQATTLRQTDEPSSDILLVLSTYCHFPTTENEGNLNVVQVPLLGRTLPLYHTSLRSVRDETCRGHLLSYLSSPVLVTDRYSGIHLGTVLNNRTPHEFYWVS